MGNWIQRNLKNIIVGCFVIPILLVAFVSISHVTSMYELSNPLVWSIYLSVGIEIAALSALAAVSVKMGRFVYLPFLIVTVIQFLGNMFSVYSEIDESSVGFKNWVELIGPLFTPMGVELTDISAQKRILAFFTGGLLPIISLTFAHMLVIFTEKHKEESIPDEPPIEDEKIEVLVEQPTEPVTEIKQPIDIEEVIEVEQPTEQPTDIKVLTYSKDGEP